METPTAKSARTLRPVITRLFRYKYPAISGVVLEHQVIFVKNKACDVFTPEVMIACADEIDIVLALWARRFGIKEAYRKLLTIDGYEMRSYPEPGVSEQLNKFLIWLSEEV